MVRLPMSSAVHKSKNSSEKAFSHLTNTILKWLFHNDLRCTLSDKRGNSLFAEVDDQRQKMKVILDVQKAHYLQVSLTLTFLKMYLVPL